MDLVRWRSGSRASLSALDSPRGPVATRMRRILSVQDVSTLDDYCRTPTIYDQMKELCSSRDDLTDLLQRELNRPKPAIVQKAKPKHPDRDVEIFVDGPPLREVYRPIVRRRRHHRARMERRKMAAGGPDDVTNNNHPTTTNGQYSTLDRLVRDQKADYDSSTAPDTLERRPYKDSELSACGTLDRLSKRQQDASISRTEFEQLCVFNKNGGEPESDTDTLTPSPGGSPKRSIEQEAITLESRNPQAITTSTASVTLQPAGQEERRTSVKDAISIFEKFKGEPRRIVTEKNPDRRSVIEEPEDTRSGISLIQVTKETNLDADLDMAVSDRVRNLENSTRDSKNRLPFKHSSELWAAPGEEGEADRPFPKIIEPTKNRGSITKPVRKSPSPRRFITREPENSPEPERRSRESEVDGRFTPDPGRQRQKRSGRSPQFNQRSEPVQAPERFEQLKPQQVQICNQGLEVTDHYDPRRPDPVIIVENRSDVPSRKREMKSARLRVNMVPQYLSGSDSSPSNDERPSRRRRDDRPREPRVDDGRVARDTRSPRDVIEHPRRAEIRDSHSSASESSRRRPRSSRCGSESDSDNKESRPRYPRPYRTEHRSLSPRSPYLQGRGPSPYDNDRGPYPDRPFHPDDFPPPIPEPYYRDRIDYHGYGLPRNDPPPLPDRTREYAGPRSGFPEHYRSADDHTYEYISPVRYAGERRSWVDMSERSPRLSQHYDVQDGSPIRGPQFVERAQRSPMRVPHLSDRPERSPMRGTQFMERSDKSPMRGPQVGERSDKSPMRGSQVGERSERSPMRGPQFVERNERSPMRGPQLGERSERSPMRGPHINDRSERSPMRGPQFVERSERSPMRGPQFEQKPGGSPIRIPQYIDHSQSSPIRIPHDQQVRIPHDQQVRIPHDQQVRIPHDQQVRIPHDQQVRIPHDQQVRIPHDQQVRIPHDQQARIPHDQQVRIPHDQPIQVPHYLEPYRDHRLSGYRPPPDFNDPRYAQVQRARSMFPRQDGVLYLPPEAQLSDTDVRYGRGSPDFMRQAVQYGYRPYQDYPGSRRSYPMYNQDPYYQPRTEPFHPGFVNRVPYHAFPDQLNPQDYRPVEYISPFQRVSYPYPRSVPTNERQPLGTVVEASLDGRQGQHTSAFKPVLESEHPSRETNIAPAANEFYSDFSLGKPVHAVDGSGSWNYGDPRNVTNRPSRETRTYENQPEVAIGQDVSQSFIAPPKPIKLVPDRADEITKPPRSGFRDAFQYQAYHAQSPMVKRAEKGLEIHKTPAEKLESSRIELDQAMEDLGLVASIEIPTGTTETSQIERVHVNEHVVYDRVSNTVIRRSRTPSTDQERDNILAEKGVIFHNVLPNVTMKTAVPQPARYGRSASDTKVEGKVKAKRPNHLPVRPGYKNATSLSSSVPNLKVIGKAEGMMELDAVLSDLKMASLKRRTESDSSSPRRRTRRSTASESDSSVLSDTRSAPDYTDKRRLRELWNSPQSGDYLMERPPDPRRAGLTPDRRPSALHDDLAYRRLRRKSEDKSSNPTGASVAKNRPVARGIDQLIAKLADVESREQNKKSRSLPDLRSVATFSVTYNDRGDVITNDPKFSQHAMSTRKTPRTVKVRSKMRQRMAEFIINTDGTDSPENSDQPFPDLLPYDESASEDASHEFESAPDVHTDKSAKYRREPLDLEVYNPRKQTMELIRDHYAKHEQTFHNVVSYFEHDDQNGSLRKYASHDDIARGESKTARRLKPGPEVSSLKERCGSDPCLSEGRTLERKKDGVYRSVLHFTVGSEEDLRSSGRPPKSHHRIDT